MTARLLFLLATWLAWSGSAGPGAALGPAPVDDPLQRLLAGVETVAAPGVPGGVCAFGSEAFVVVDGAGSTPVIAGATFGEGRVLVLGHTGYLSLGALDAGDTERFFKNALRWLSSKKSPRVVAPGNADRAGMFRGLGAKAEATDALDEADVVVLDAHSALPARRREELTAFVRDGGGLLMAATGWGWAQLNPTLVLARDLPGNRLLVPMGLAFTGESVGKTAGELLAATPPPPPLAHAGLAFASLERGWLEGTELDLALARLRGALGALPDHEPRLILPLRWILEGAAPAGSFAPLAERYRAREWRPLSPRFGPWRAVGPFPHPRGDRDVKPGQAPEKKLEQLVAGGPGPDLGATFRTRGGRTGWGAVDAAGDDAALDIGAIRLDAMWPGEERAVAYLHRAIDADEPLRVALRVGSDDGLRLWLNGELLVDRDASPGIEVDEAPLTLALQAGRNHLLAKVTNERGAWGLRLRRDETFDPTLVEAGTLRAVRWLLEQQLLDGSWAGWPGYGPGYTAFVTYTLAKCGLPPNHPALARAFDYLSTHAAAHTYSLSSMVLALAALSTEPARAQLPDAILDLVEMQEPNGLYSYPQHPDHGGGAPDLSCTLMAALAFRAAASQGVDVPDDVWRGLIDGTLLCWKGAADARSRRGKGEGQGFSYNVGGNATGSMTTAGVSVLKVALDHLGNRLDRGTRKEAQVAMASGLAWLETHWQWNRNPNHTGFQFFWLYGIERLGALLQERVLGKVDWYPSGAEYLLQRQKDDGSWAGEGGHGDARSDTCLALLFLRRATAPQSAQGEPPLDLYTREDPELALSFRAKGSNPLTVWVTGWGDAVRAELAWPGATTPAPRVEELRYLARRPGAPEPVVLAVIAGREDEIGAQRFEARLRFPEPGTWELSLEADALRPPAGRGLPPEPVELTSGVLTLSVPGPPDPRATAYPDDAEKNLLRNGRARVEASSFHTDQDAAKAVDGSYATRWHCGVDEAEPWWRCVLPTAAAADRLYLTHAWPRAKDRDAPRPARVRVTLDGEETFELDVDPEPWNKTTLLFGEPRRIKTLEVRVLASRGRQLGRDAVGFSEIELVNGD